MNNALKPLPPFFPFDPDRPAKTPFQRSFAEYRKMLWRIGQDPDQPQRAAELHVAEVGNNRIEDTSVEFLPDIETFAVQRSPAIVAPGIDDIPTSTALVPAGPTALDLYDVATRCFAEVAALAQDQAVNLKRAQAKALAAVYDLYLPFHADRAGWERFLGSIGVELAPQTKHIASPLLQHLVAGMDAPLGAYGKSNWAAAIAYGASQNLTVEEFESEFKELGARKMANQLRLDDQPKATRLKAAQEQKALVNQHFATSDLANLDLIEATASLEAGYHCLYLRKTRGGAIDIVASDRTDQNVLETTLAKQAVRAKAEPKSKRERAKQRHTSKMLREPNVLAKTHPAIVSGTTLHPHLKRKATPFENVLKSGRHSRKLGDRAVVGKCKGMTIDSFALVERETCPITCRVYHICYGNRMSQPRAWRYETGPELLKQLEIEFAIRATEPATRHGFIVRFHALGDFYSVEYVEWWGEQLAKFPALHAFGYTARSKSSEIGQALARVKPRSRTGSGCGGPILATRRIPRWW